VEITTSEKLFIEIPQKILAYTSAINFVYPGNELINMNIEKIRGNIDHC